ncbi:MAG: long-chain fatty acid--CoA ligase [Acidobacteria bacterium]|nr:long-chain fatty acid--CoA ligase [Acidobacteriota bacterium]
MQFPNIYSLFRAQCEKYRERDVFYTRDGDGWSAQTWGEFEDKVHDLACALLAKGLTEGASVAILAGNVPEWTICDIAAIAAGGVGVGIYPTSSAEQAHFIINHSDAEFVVVDTVEQLRKLDGVGMPKVREVFLIESVDDIDTLPTGRVSAFYLTLALGRSKREEFMPRVEELGFGATSVDTAIMVYTSGTTGEPKGAMLSHKYVLNSVESLRRSVPIFETDVALSYLPGCHVAERISGIYNRLYSGTAAYFVDDLSKLYAYMFEVKPTVFASLPRFFEKIHAKVAADPEAGKEALKAAFGGNVRLLTSGGAPLPLEIADFYARHELPILQAYGLTENICVAFNTVDEHKFGTVGKPMPMCEVRIAEDGEILVRSDMMFSGYFKEPEKTAEMFDADGWLETGDLGELDEDGFLKITGRKKEIIVLSNGKNVAPALIENFVKESHLISHCFLFGDGRSYCVALITINVNEAASMCREQIEGLVDQAVAAANARVSSSEQIKQFVILDSDFSAERDEITPTMKLKRNVIAANHKDLLEKMYEKQN